MDNVDMRELLAKLDENDQRIEEAYHDPQKARFLLKSLGTIYDNLQTLQDRLDHGQLARFMLELDYSGEQRSMLDKVTALLVEFEDIMPGLDMTVNGE